MVAHKGVPARAWCARACTNACPHARTTLPVLSRVYCLAAGALVMPSASDAVVAVVHELNGTVNTANGSAVGDHDNDCTGPGSCGNDLMLFSIFIWMAAPAWMSFLYHAYVHWCHGPHLRSSAEVCAEEMSRAGLSPRVSDGSGAERYSETATTDSQLQVRGSRPLSSSLMSDDIY